jgi:hypothetical protein
MNVSIRKIDALVVLCLAKLHNYCIDANDVTACLSQLTICPWYVYSTVLFGTVLTIQYRPVRMHSDIPVTKSGM